MSMIFCHDCDRIFDTDDDPDCWIEVGNMRRMTWEVPVCEPCRQIRLDEIERLADAESRAMAAAEQRQ